MRRKLVKQGPSSLTISLPKDWTDRFNLKGGEEVELEEVDKKILISSLQKNKSAITTTYDFKEISESLVHDLLVSVYRGGLKDVSLVGLSPKKMSLIKSFVSNVIGFEIISETKDSVHIVDLGIADEYSLNQAETQIFWKILNQIDMIKNTSIKYDEIKKFDLEINRLAHYVQRNICTEFSKDSNNFIRYEKIGALEVFADSLRYFKKYSLEFTKKDLEILDELASIINDLRPSKLSLEELYAIDRKIAVIVSRLEVFGKKRKEALEHIFLIRSLNQIYELTFAMNLANITKK